MEYKLPARLAARNLGPAASERRLLRALGRDSPSKATRRPGRFASVAELSKMERPAGMRTFRLIIFWFCGTAAVAACWGIWTLLLAMTYFLHGRSSHPAVEAALITIFTICALVIWRTRRKPSRHKH